MTGRSWADWIILTAALVTALGVIWRKGIRPFFRTVNEVAQAVPILADIASEFRPNSGTSLRDVIDDMRTSLATIAASQAQITADHATIMGDHAELKERLAAQSIQLTNVEQAAAPHTPTSELP